MPVNVIGTLKPKNNGKFPVAEAVDIKVTDNLRLDEALENKADLSTVNFALNQKAEKTTTESLQGQINQIVISASAEAVVAPEVAAARVGYDGTSYQTLKERLDSENTSIRQELKSLDDFVNSALHSSANLFDKDSAEIESGCYITSNSIKTDSYTAARISHWIQVKRGVAYKYNVDNYFGVNANKLIFSATKDMSDIIHFNGTLTENDSFVTFIAENDGYIKFNQAEGMANIQMFCNNADYPSEYTSFGIILDDKVELPKPSASDIQGDITKEQVDFIEHHVSENLFDKNSIVEGHYLMPTDGRIEDNVNYFYTFIPVIEGNFTLMVDSLIFGQYNAFNLPLFDEDHQYVGVVSGTSPTSANVKEQEAHFTLTQERIDSLGAKYIGYSSDISIKDDLMIVKGDTYPSEYIPYVNRYVLVGVEPEEQIRDDYIKNSLSSKIVVFDGDSICQATSEGTSGRNGWPYRIGTNNHMDWANVGVNGGTITAELYASGGVARHWLSRYIDTIHSNYEELDYLILEGGTNDADLLGENGIGVFDANDYSGSYDDTNFTGALDSLFYKAINYYPNAKIGFIIAQKMGVSNDYTTTSNIRRIYFERAMDVCKKWGVPYINLWDNSALNPKLPCFFDSSLDAQGNRDGGYAYTDGQHLTGKGYDIVSPKIEAWMRTL